MLAAGFLTALGVERVNATSRIGDRTPEAALLVVVISGTIAARRRAPRTGFLISIAEDIDLVAQAADGLQAVELCISTSPDVALMDMWMPEIDRIEATPADHRGRPGERLPAQARLAGAADRLIDAVRTLAAGEALLDPAVTLTWWPNPSATACTPACTGPAGRLSHCRGKCSPIS
jgi:CheY-like chemotaxis protein